MSLLLHRPGGCLLLPLLLAATAPCRAQPTDNGARVERLADGVYAILHDDAVHDWPSGATDWPHGNTGVIVGDDGVLVVDTTYLPSRARADIALIRALTDRPVRWVVNTHWHGDHTHGNGVYREAFPDAVFVGPRESRGFIELNLARWPRRATAPGSARREGLTALEATLTTGRDSLGNALDPAARARLEDVVRERRSELAELATVEVVAPTLLFDEALTLDLGGRQVELRNQGRANSPADVTIYLPAERVLFTGDIVVHPVPYAWSSHPVPWIDVLRAIEALPVVALVPGHGPVFSDHAYTREVRTLFETATARVADAIRTGAGEEEVVSAVDLSDLRPRFVTDDDPTAALFWASSIEEALLQRSWACLVGYRC